MSLLVRVLPREIGETLRDDEAYYLSDDNVNNFFRQEVDLRSQNGYNSYHEGQQKSVSLGEIGGIPQEYNYYSYTPTYNNGQEQPHNDAAVLYPETSTVSLHGSLPQLNHGDGNTPQQQQPQEPVLNPGARFVAHDDARVVSSQRTTTTTSNNNYQEQQRYDRRDYQARNGGNYGQYQVNSGMRMEVDARRGSRDRGGLQGQMQVFPIDTVKEDPGMSDSMILATKPIEEIKRKYPVSGLAKRMSIAASDLLGKSHDELILLLIQLNREKSNLERLADYYRIIIQRQLEEERGASGAQVQSLRERSNKYRRELSDIENQIELSQPLITFIDNIVKMGSLYGGDDLMFASEYRSHLLQPGEFRALPENVNFMRRMQEKNVSRELRGDYDVRDGEVYELPDTFQAAPESMEFRKTREQLESELNELEKVYVNFHTKKSEISDYMTQVQRNGLRSQPPVSPGARNDGKGTYKFGTYMETDLDTNRRVDLAAKFPRRLDSTSSTGQNGSYPLRGSQTLPQGRLSNSSRDVRDYPASRSQTLPDEVFREGRSTQDLSYRSREIRPDQNEMITRETTSRTMQGRPEQMTREIRTMELRPDDRSIARGNPPSMTVERRPEPNEVFTTRETIRTMELRPEDRPVSREANWRTMELRPEDQPTSRAASMRSMELRPQDGPAFREASWRTMELRPEDRPVSREVSMRTMELRPEDQPVSREASWRTMELRPEDQPVSREASWRTMELRPDANDVFVKRAPQSQPAPRDRHQEQVTTVTKVQHQRTAPPSDRYESTTLQPNPTPQKNSNNRHSSVQDQLNMLLGGGGSDAPDCGSNKDVSDDPWDNPDPPSPTRPLLNFNPNRFKSATITSSSSTGNRDKGLVGLGRELAKRQGGTVFLKCDEDEHDSHYVAGPTPSAGSHQHQHQDDAVVASTTSFVQHGRVTNGDRGSDTTTASTTRTTTTRGGTKIVYEVDDSVRIRTPSPRLDGGHSGFRRQEIDYSQQY